jgi:hypothetical protein
MADIERRVQRLLDKPDGDIPEVEVLLLADLIAAHQSEASATLAAHALELLAAAGSDDTRRLLCASAVVRPIVALLASQHGQIVRKIAASVLRLLTDVDDAQSEAEAEDGSVGEDDDDSEADVEDEDFLEHLEPPQGEKEEEAKADIGALARGCVRAAGGLHALFALLANRDANADAALRSHACAAAVNVLFCNSGADQSVDLPSGYDKFLSQPPIATHPLLDAISMDVDAGATLHEGGTLDAGGTLRLEALRLAHMVALLMHDPFFTELKGPASDADRLHASLARALECDDDARVRELAATALTTLTIDGRTNPHSSHACKALVCALSLEGEAARVAAARALAALFNSTGGLVTELLGTVPGGESCAAPHARALDTLAGALGGGGSELAIAAAGAVHEMLVVLLKPASCWEPRVGDDPKRIARLRRAREAALKRVLASSLPLALMECSADPDPIVCAHALRALALMSAPPGASDVLASAAGARLRELRAEIRQLGHTTRAQAALVGSPDASVHDVTFACADGTQIGASRALIVANSHYYRTLLGPGAQTRECAEARVEPDAQFAPCTHEALLRQLHAGGCAPLPDAADELLELMKLAAKLVPSEGARTAQDKTPDNGGAVDVAAHLFARCEAAAIRALSLDTCLSTLVYAQACGSEQLLASVHRLVDERLPELVSTSQWREFKCARTSEAAELMERAAVATFGQLKRDTLVPPPRVSHVKRPLSPPQTRSDGASVAAQPGGAAAAAPAAAAKDYTRSSDDDSDAPLDDEKRRCRSKWAFPVLDAGRRGPESFCHDIPDRDRSYMTNDK